MNQPQGRGEMVINSIDLLNEKQPVIGTGEWDDFQCRNFKGEGNNPLKIGDIILVHEGKKPIALCRIVSENFKDSQLTEKYINQNFRKVDVLEFYKGNQTIKDNQGTLKRFVAEGKETWNFIHNWHIEIKTDMEINTVKTLLEHKKQIILQGPPGTGKTRLAKELARTLVKNDYSQLAKVLLVGIKIPNASGAQDYYTIKSLKESSVVLTSERATQDWEPTFENVLEKLRQLYLKETPINVNGLHPYELAIAKHLYSMAFKLNKNYQLIQFHPSYTYEDFVRGITVKAGDNGLEYVTENKILAKIAKEAHQNYLDSKKESSEINYEKWLKEQFEEFKDSVLDGMDDDGKFKLNDAVNIIEVEEDAFRYTGENNWSSTRRMKYADIILLYSFGIKDRQEIKQQNNVNALARSHATYFKLVLDLFYTFMKDKVVPSNSSEKVELKNYVLIIDEINRANLSSVLGELIYALEYRGEPVESMYVLEDGGNTIILPPNLYIIGTMNTADRSVGQIDYAIRRRFAFVDVLPKILDNAELEKEGKKFAKTSFEKVTELFIENNDVNKPSTHLSEEFNPKDVWLGHSYFIHKENEFNMNLEYEIKPILREYVADGILKESALEIINGLSVTND